MSERSPEPWDGSRLHLVLAYAYDAFGKKGRVDANQVARELHVTPSTVRRWLRHQLPARRREIIAERVLPGHPALEQERRELDYARDALGDIYSRDKTRLLPAWKKNGWLEPHILAVVHLERLGVCVPRIARANGDQKTRDRLRADGGVIVDQGIFPNRFAAQIAKGQILEQAGAWRIVIPHGYATRGRTEAWLEAAPRERVSWFVDNAPIRPRAVRRRAPKRKPSPA